MYIYICRRQRTHAVVNYKLQNHFGRLAPNRFGRRGFFQNATRANYTFQNFSARWRAPSRE